MRYLSCDVQAADLAWAAGFYEGEGCLLFSLSRDPRGRRNPLQRYGHLLLEIVQADPEPLNHLLNIFPKSRLTGPEPHHQGHKDIWRFRISNFEGTQAALAMMWPWLSRRRKDQAKTALLAFYRHNKARPRLRHGPLQEGEIALPQS